ncbi:MAG TPA: Mrp/NBP35 family ATP-binding protein [bacterium]|nr:Mrp/NBP35 family ATP-binding protein [bacterium]
MAARSIAVTREQVLEALRDVMDPELHRSIVELNMVKDVAIRDGTVRVDALLTISGCPLRETITDSIKEKVRALPGVTTVDVQLGVMTQEQRQALIGQLRPGPQKQSPILSPTSTTRVLTIASGKGGVGKSTVTTNLAVALARRGRKVGVVDADVYGFSIPRMLGVSGKPTIIDQMIIPLERWGVRVISIGFMVDENEAVMWRGPMLHKAITTFLSEVYWEDVDDLLIDLPPGTGDVALTIAQTLPRAEMLIITTPQETATGVAYRAGRMAEKVNTPVVGVVENMSYYLPAPGAQPVYIFGRGGGERLAKLVDAPLLGQIPLDPAIREAGDRGQPVTATAPDSASAQVFYQIADALLGPAK